MLPSPSDFVPLQYIWQNFKMVKSLVICNAMFYFGTETFMKGLSSKINWQILNHCIDNSRQHPKQHLCCQKLYEQNTPFVPGKSFLMAGVLVGTLQRKLDISWSSLNKQKWIYLSSSHWCERSVTHWMVGCHSRNICSKGKALNWPLLSFLHFFLTPHFIAAHFWSFYHLSIGTVVYY